MCWVFCVFRRSLEREWINVDGVVEVEMGIFGRREVGAMSLHIQIQTTQDEP